MAKNIPDTQIDAMLDVVEGDAVHVCSAEPTTYAEASATFQLASDALVGGDYAKADGDVSGRKNTLTSPADSTIDNTGTGTHIAVTISGTTLKLVTTCTSQALTSGGTVTISPFAHEILDAA